jgi:Uma2 family endonuclease
MALPATPAFTAEEYLALERSARTKHEFYDGYILGMSGASRNHMRIQSNLIRILGLKLLELKRPCWVAGSDMRVKVSPTRFFYPDVTLICGAEKMDDQFQDNLENPEVVIEILSDSTESYDRSEKAAAYREIPALKQFLLFSTRKIAVEIHSRKADHLWDIQEVARSDQSFEIAGIPVLLTDIYSGTNIH